MKEYCVHEVSSLDVPPTSHKEFETSTERRVMSSPPPPSGIADTESVCKAIETSQLNLGFGQTAVHHVIPCWWLLAGEGEAAAGIQHVPAGSSDVFWQVRWGFVTAEAVHYKRHVMRNGRNAFTCMGWTK